MTNKSPKLTNDELNRILNLLLGLKEELRLLNDHSVKITEMLEDRFDRIQDQLNQIISSQSYQH